MQAGTSIETPALILLLKQKSSEGFAILYDKYGSYLHGIICKMVRDEIAAEDVLQDVLVKVWKNIGHFNEEKGSFYTWLINIARYTAIDYLRSRQRKQQLKNQMVTGNEYMEEQSLGLSEDAGLKMIVTKLDAKYREVIDLLYFYGYTQDEASKKLNLPLGTLKTRARTALQILRNQLAQWM